MATPVQTSVKVQKGKFDRKFRPYISEKDTQPIGDVYRDGKLIEGLTEGQKLSEGLVPPLAWQGEKKPDGNPIGRFQKTPKEREELKRVHSGAKGPSGGYPRNNNTNQFRSTLIIHRVNVHHKKDFKTTLSLQAFPNEVQYLVNAYHDPKKHKLVNKYYYRGKCGEIE